MSFPFALLAQADDVFPDSSGGSGFIGSLPFYLICIALTAGLAAYWWFFLREQ